MKNSFRIISSLLILIAFSCSSFISFAQSDVIKLKDAYGLQKSHQNKQVNVSSSTTSSDVLIENEVEDNEESVSDSDFISKLPLFNAVTLLNKTYSCFDDKTTVSLTILYCVFRI